MAPDFSIAPRSGKSQGRALRPRDGGAHGRRHRRQGRREGADRAGRLDRGGLDRRRLRARRGAEGGARSAWPTASRGWSRSRRRICLTRLGVAPGEDRAGVLFANNACPSQGTMDIFVEPVLPQPTLLILGASPVAVALASLAPTMGFDVTVAARRGASSRVSTSSRDKVEGFSRRRTAARDAYVVVSTQGAGDRAALKAAVAMEARYRAFVGSRRKAEALRERTCRRGRFARPARRGQSAGRPRHRRHHHRRNRAVDPGGNDRASATRSPNYRRRPRRGDDGA